MADVNLPGVGPVSKKWLIIVAAGSAVTIGYVVIRRRSAAASTGASAASSEGTIDPLTGDIAGSAQDQADLAALQAGGGYDDGLGTDGSGLQDFGGYLAAAPAGGTIPGAGGFTTNGEWAQQAEQDLGGIGIDETTLSAALGAYLTGRALTSDQQSLVDQAIAEEGYPPVSGTGGYPPAMKTGGSLSSQPPISTPSPAPGTKVKVPDVTGKRVDVADAALKAAGLKASAPGWTAGKAWSVASQSPAAGASVAKGSTVTLKIKSP
ncbi:MAG: PASTA domain-containing protein [Streptosporangiaceae bacterium]